MDSKSEKLTIALKKDRILNSFIKIVNGKSMPIALEDLQDSVRDICLKENVPQQVKKVFESSKKLYTHGYFCYDFFTVSQHYAFLALESALRNRYKGLSGKEKFSLKEIIDMLLEKGIISEDKRFLYDASRHLRNALSHLTDTKVLTPSTDILERIAELINRLYQ